MKDELGNRIKTFYEDRYRYMLPRRSYIIIRIDGKAFHSFTKSFQKPFDPNIIKLMDQTAIDLCKNIMNAKFAYVQSDEISILLTDFETYETQAWFDNNMQKIVSISASIATSSFNKQLVKIRPDSNFANFDSRVFVLPSWTEVINYFIWRQADCVRNSIQSVARSIASHSECNNKNTKQLQELYFQKTGKNWNDLEDSLKRGRLISKVTVDDKSKWEASPMPWITMNREMFETMVPKIDDF